MDIFWPLAPAVLTALVLVDGEEISEWIRFIPKDDYDAILKRPLKMSFAMANPSTTGDAFLGPGLYQEDIVGCGLKGQAACTFEGYGSSKWPKSNDHFIIPYTVSPDISESLQTLLEEALGVLQDNVSCLVFRPEADPSAVSALLAFTSHTACAAEFGGLKKNVHQIFLGEDCLQGQRGNIHRLIMLAFGFTHEITRNDRDDNVHIIWENINPDKKDELTKDGPEMMYVAPYDYDSVLHPDYVFLSVAENAPTLTAKDRVATLGQRAGLSKGDIVKLNIKFCSPRQNVNPPGSTDGASKNGSAQLLQSSVNITQSLYTVVSGDYASLIASRFGMTLDEIRKLNPENGTLDLIRPGGVLRVRCSTSGFASPSASAGRLRTVQQGDSAWTIAKENNLTLDQLRLLNPGLGSMDLLCVGSSIVVAGSSEGAVDTYVVQPGDFAQKIASQFGMTLEELQRLNPGKGSMDLIKAGELLKLRAGASKSRTGS